LTAEKIPLFALAAISSVVTILVQQHGGAVSGLERVPLSIRLTNAMASYLDYMGKMLWPARLSPFYPLVPSAPVIEASLGALAIIGIAIFVVRSGRRHGYLPVGWLWYLGTLVPVIGLVQVGGQSMADRYTYVPLTGLFLIAAWGAPEVLSRWRYGKSLLPVMAVCVLLACAALSRAEVQYWSDGAALWQHALENSENNYTAHNNLGGILLKQGRANEALPHFAEALRIKPDLAVAQANLGMALMSLGRPDQAAPHFIEAQRIDPNYPDAHDGLGNALATQGRVREAAEQFSEALRLRPDYPAAHNDLGVALARQGKLDEAARQFAEAVRVKPDFADAYHNLGNALAGQGRLPEAIEQYTEAVRLGPGSAETHNDLGVALAQMGRLDEAAPHFAEALRIRPDFVDASENLKRAAAMRGRTAQ
jgi:tetratricopeptide (TPR) repeat protein